jgi:hypothetical protein
MSATLSQDLTKSQMSLMRTERWHLRTSKTARHYNVELSETGWHELDARPQQHRQEAAAKAVKTKRERGELKEIADKAIETKREHGVLERAASKAAATRKRKRKQAR